jgi:hypothetical protein
MDNSFLKADIFFFVTTLAVVAVTLILVVGLIYVVSILRTIKKISRTAQTGAETIVEGIQDAKNEIDKNGFVPSAISKIFTSLYKQTKPKKK